MVMKRVHTPNQSRKQAEEDILRDMRKILTGLSEHKNSAAKESKVDKKHVLSVVSHFTALKRAVKF